MGFLTPDKDFCTKKKKRGGRGRKDSFLLATPNPFLFSSQSFSAALVSFSHKQMQNKKAQRRRGRRAKENKEKKGTFLAAFLGGLVFFFFSCFWVGAKQKQTLGGCAAHRPSLLLPLQLLIEFPWKASAPLDELQKANFSSGPFSVEFFFCFWAFVGLDLFCFPKLWPVQHPMGAAPAEL